MLQFRFEKCVRVSTCFKRSETHRITWSIHAYRSVMVFVCESTFFSMQWKKQVKQAHPCDFEWPFSFFLRTDARARPFWELRVPKTCESTFSQCNEKKQVKQAHACNFEWPFWKLRATKTSELYTWISVSTSFERTDTKKTSQLVPAAAEFERSDTNLSNLR